MGERDKEQGAWDKTAGKVKEEWGDLTDDPKTEMEGKLQQGKGEVQSRLGEAKEEAREEEAREG